MHQFRDADEELAKAVTSYVVERISELPSLDKPEAREHLRERVGSTISELGSGWRETLELFDKTLSRACVSTDFPRHLSFVPAAPTKAAVLFDLIVGASSIYGGSWLEGAGAVYAENQALRWIADLAHMGPGAGGCFVAGGTAGNLSGLVAARHSAAAKRSERPQRWAVVASSEAHSSIASACAVMDVAEVSVPVDDRFRLTAEAVASKLEAMEPKARAGVFAVVASAGTTNLAAIDDLAGLAALCEREGLWFHVDAAFGGAALASQQVRADFDGIEHADSLVVDPHKWLFSPFDCAALIYKNPELARAAHTQHAGYLAPITDRDEWNPSDYAHHLSRRARGLPFWFSLATHGTAAYAEAVTVGIDLASKAAELIEAHPALELVWGPQLCVVLFRRPGWGASDYTAWSNKLLDDGIGLVVATSHSGETMLRFCFVNPTTTEDDIELILSTLL